MPNDGYARYMRDHNLPAEGLDPPEEDHDECDCDECDECEARRRRPDTEDFFDKLDRLYQARKEGDL